LGLRYGERVAFNLLSIRRGTKNSTELSNRAFGSRGRTTRTASRGARHLRRRFAQVKVSRPHAQTSRMNPTRKRAAIGHTISTPADRLAIQLPTFRSIVLSWFRDVVPKNRGFRPTSQIDMARGKLRALRETTWIRASLRRGYLRAVRL